MNKQSIFADGVAVKRSGKRIKINGFLPFIEDEMRLAMENKRRAASAPRLRRSGDRPQSLGSGRMTKAERLFAGWDEWKAEAAGEKFSLPRTFGECPPSGVCPHVSCRHHAAIEVDGDRIKVNFPGVDLADMPETCTLRVANAGECKRGSKDEIGSPVMSCEEVGKILNITTERIRQLEQQAKVKIRLTVLADWREK